MGNKSSAALGSAAQFMPQPDGLYQERLQGITGVKGTAPDTSNEKMVADSLGGAVGSYLDFSNSHRQKFEAEMDKAAQDMINSASLEAVEALNIVDMSQQYGYGTLVDNPYWRAAVSRKAGERLMTTLDAQYNDLYGDNRMANIDEERQRYEDFVSSRQDEYMQRLPIDNQVSFQAGFNTRKTQSIQSLMDNYSQRDVADKLTQMAADAQSELGDIASNAPGMTEEEVTKQTNAIFGNVRLSNLAPEVRYKLLSNYFMDLTKTGVFDSDTIMRIAKNVSVVTRLDGTTETAADLLDSNAIHEGAVAWQSAHITQFKLDLAKKYKGITDIGVYDADIIKLRQSKKPADWRTAAIMESFRPQIASQAAETKRIRFAQQQERSKQSKAAAKKSDAWNLVMANMQLRKDGNTNAVDIYGNAEGNLYYNDGTKVSQQDIQAVLNQYMADLLSDKSKDAGSRLSDALDALSWAGASEFVKDYRDRLLYNMQNISKDSLAQGVVEGTYVNLYNMYKVNPQNFRTAFGDKMGSAFDIINRLANNAGYEDPNTNLAIGLNKWQDVSKMPQDQLNAYETQVDNYFTTVRKSYGSAPDIDGVFDMNQGNPITVTFDDINNGDLAQELASYYMATGCSIDEAVANVGADFRDNYVYKWGAMLPKSIAYSVYPSGADTTNALPLFNRALNSYAYALTKDSRYDQMQAPYDEQRISIKYDSYSGVITMRDTYSQNYITISLGEIQNQMKYLAANNDVITVISPANTTEADSSVSVFQRGSKAIY